MAKIFQISQRHYDIIIKQAQDNYPKEAGGFIGGDSLVIKAILPAHNQHLYDKTATYGLTSDDIDRAHRFFKKHKLSYYGVYHTHPNGVAYPSETDINTNMKYHFIVGLQDVSKPQFAAFEIQDKNVIPIPLQIVANNTFTPIDIRDPEGAKAKKRPQNMFEQAEELSEKIDNIIQEKPNYQKMDPKLGFGASDFSTLA